MSKLSNYFPQITRDDFYKPAMMQFDGSTGYYSKSYTPTGNKIAVALRFKISSFTGNTFGTMVSSVSGAVQRIALIAYSSDYSTTALQNCIQFQVYTGSTVLCKLLTPSTYLDGEIHSLVCYHDGDAGTGGIIIDGVDADDTGNTERVAPTTGTLSTASHTLSMGRWATAAINWLNGSIGFSGVDEAGTLTYSDFFDSNNNPIKQDETTWANSGWGSQPLFWNEHGDMLDNNGSAGNMTRNGTIVVTPTT